MLQWSATKVAILASVQTNLPHSTKATFLLCVETDPELENVNE